MDNVETLPVKNVQDIPGRLRDLAARLEAGEFSGFTGCAVILADDTGMGIRTFAFGSVPTQAHMVGIMQTATVLTAGNGHFCLEDDRREG